MLNEYFMVDLCFLLMVILDDKYWVVMRLLLKNGIGR